MFENDWYSKYSNRSPPVLGRNAYVKQVEIRHSLSDRDVSFRGGDRSKTLLFGTKRNFDYKVTAPNHVFGQVTAFSRSDLHITESILKKMKHEKSMEVGIKIKCDAHLDDLTTTVVSQEVEGNGIDWPDGEITLKRPIFMIDTAKGAKIPAADSPFRSDILTGQDRLADYRLIDSADR